MKKLEPFNPDIRCPKCGHEDIHARFDKDEYECLYSEPKWKGEHIHRHCRRCSFNWIEAALDSGRKDGGE